MRVLFRPFLSSLPKSDLHPIRGIATHLRYSPLRNLFNYPTPAPVCVATCDKQNLLVTAAATSQSPSWRFEERAPRPVLDTLNSVTATLRDAVFVAYKGEIKANPTESEFNVWADRSDDDPLPPEKKQTILMPAGDLAPKPTESEEDVRADQDNGELFQKKSVQK